MALNYSAWPSHFVDFTLAAFPFLDPKTSLNTTLVVLVVVVISSLKMPKAFLIRRGAQ